MPKALHKMRLSLEEERFLRRWIYDEAHFQEGAGPAKRLQIAHSVVSADLATLVAAAMPDLAEQEAAADGPPPPEPCPWPWSAETWPKRLATARAVLTERHKGREPTAAK
jgi:hypothetical protein